MPTDFSRKRALSERFFCFNPCIHVCRIVLSEYEKCHIEFSELFIQFSRRLLRKKLFPCSGRKHMPFSPYTKNGTPKGSVGLTLCDFVSGAVPLYRPSTFFNTYSRTSSRVMPREIASSPNSPSSAIRKYFSSLAVDFLPMARRVFLLV